MKSEKRERFERVASKRVEKILHYLDLLGNCANRSNYEYTKEDVNKMFREIQNHLNFIKKKFEIELNKDNQRFKF